MRGMIHEPVPQGFRHDRVLIGHERMEHVLKLDECTSMFRAMFIDNGFTHFLMAGTRQICPGNDIAHKRIFMTEMLRRGQIKGIQQTYELLRRAFAKFGDTNLIYDAKQAFMLDVQLLMADSVNPLPQHRHIFHQHIDQGLRTYETMAPGSML